MINFIAVLMSGERGQAFHRLQDVQKSSAQHGHGSRRFLHMNTSEDLQDFEDLHLDQFN